MNLLGTTYADANRTRGSRGNTGTALSRLSKLRDGPGEDFHVSASRSAAPSASHRDILPQKASRISRFPNSDPSALCLM